MTKSKNICKKLSFNDCELTILRMAVDEAEKKLGQKKYTGYLKRPEYELYDIINDPFEQVNIIQQPHYQKEIAVLKSNLIDWMRQQGDKGIESELAVCDRKGFSHKRCP